MSIRHAPSTPCVAPPITPADASSLTPTPCLPAAPRHAPRGAACGGQAIPSGGAADALAGALAGALTALATTPLDLVNTRLQTQATGYGAAALSGEYASVGDALVRIMREEGGAMALLQGAGFRMLQYAPSAVVFFFVYFIVFLFFFFFVF